ncbi:MAG: diaminopimelate epimerase [Bacteroidetes bacterium]|nr:diaminopimelate epimerase [Bacteroidota bacterium]
MNLHFYKYQGAGNDFILIDNRDKNVSLNKTQIAFLCNRRFGIGADGLMLLENIDGFDFKMVYYNADGNESTMCGNGGRCITAFAKNLGLIDNVTSFIAIDGPHNATINNDNTISLQMVDVNAIDADNTRSILNTGSPHYVLYTTDLQNKDVVSEGRAIRNRMEYQPDGINVNFVQPTEDGISVRTYERGVEDETLSCGTGVTAAAIATSGNKTGNFNTFIHTPGGTLTVSFTKPEPGKASHVILRGPAEFVFSGTIAL